MHYQLKISPRFYKSLDPQYLFGKQFLNNTEKLVVPDDLIYRQFRVLN